PSLRVPPPRNRRRALWAMTRGGLIPVRAHLRYPFGSAYLSPRRRSGGLYPTWRYPFGRRVASDATRSAWSLDKSPSQREDHRMGAVGGTELGDQGLDALLDRVLGEDHRACDLLVGVALGKVTEELELPGREG